MSKKKNQKKEVTEKKVNSKSKKKQEKASNQSDNNQAKEKEKVTTEELLILEKDKNLRLFAEFENFKKRTAKERIDLFRNAGVEFFEAMLPILDDFDRAAKHREEANDTYELQKGFDLIHPKLLSVLEQKGLKSMDSSVGKDFDTDFHEAITQISAPSDDLKGKVIDETEKGYFLNDKVIRYAKVVVGQ